MSREVRDALQTRLLADTRVATTIAGCTEGVPKLEAGQGAAWTRGDLLHVTGADAEAANDLACAQVLSVAGDDLTIDPPLPVAPSAGVTVSGGAREWLRYLSVDEPGLYYFKRLQDAPVEQLFTADADSRVVAIHADPTDTPELGTLVRMTWLLVLMGRDPAWIEGLTQRGMLLFHAEKGAISVDARDVQELSVKASEITESGDGLYQRILTIEVVTSDVLEGTYLVASVEDRRERAHADLTAVLTTALGATAIVERVHFDVDDFGRWFDRASWPKPGRALVLCIEGDGTGVRVEKQSERINVKSRVEIRVWAYDRRSYAQLAATLNEYLFRLGEAAKGVNANDSWGDQTRGYRFEFSDWGLLRGKASLPPYAGAGVTAVGSYRV